MKINEILDAFKNREPQHINQEKVQSYAILLPIVEENEKLHLLFEVRAKHLNVQPGEICFPGGRVEESDDGLADAAIRETSEELGIDPHQIVDVYPLDYSIGNMNFYPYVGRLLEPQEINPDPDEVDSVFMIPIEELLAIEPFEHEVKFAPILEDDFPFELIPNGRDYRWFPRKTKLYFYLYEDKVIWGLTAQFLYHFLEVVRSKIKMNS